MAWTQKQWNNVTGTPQAGDLPLDADNMNRLEDGISEALKAATTVVKYHAEIRDPQNSQNFVQMMRVGEIVEVTFEVHGVSVPASSMTNITWANNLPAPTHYVDNKDYEGLTCVLGSPISDARLAIKNMTNTVQTVTARWHFTYIEAGPTTNITL